MPEWVHHYKRELVAAAAVVFVSIAAAIIHSSGDSGIVVQGASTQFSAEAIKGWMNAAVLQDSKEGDPNKACPDINPGAKANCSQARKDVQQTVLKRILPQIWALAETEANNAKLPDSEVSFQTKVMLNHLISQTHSSSPEQALQRAGLTNQDIADRARAVVALAKLIPPPSAPTAAEVKTTYNRVKSSFQGGPAGSIEVWDYASKAQAENAAGGLRSGGKPQQKSVLALKNVPYSQSDQMPPPWGGFIKRPEGIFVAACGGKWCAGIVGKPLAPRPAPPLNEVYATLKSSIMFAANEARSAQVQKILARKWSSKTSCSDLPVCS